MNNNRVSLLRFFGAASIAAGVIAAGVIAAGCQNAPVKQSARPGGPPAVATDGHFDFARAVPTTQPAQDDSPATADVLAQKAATYAKDIGPLLPAHDPKLDGPAVAQAIDPDGLRLMADASPPPAPTPAGKPTPAPAPSANQATAVLASAANPVREPQLAGQFDPTDSLARRLAEHVHDDPQDLAGQLDYQLLQMLQGQSIPQLPALSALSPEDREVVSALCDGLSNFRDAVRSDNNMLLSRKVRPLLEMADRLRNQAELSIPTVALCKRVDGFGVYEPIEGQRFAAGVEQPVIVYCEVENFASQLTEQQLWQTKLKQQVVLYTEQSGLEVWREKESKPVVDLSRNRRHDFFVVQMIRLPASLTIGQYLLKVSVEDLTVNRIAENTVGIEIVAE